MATRKARPKASAKVESAAPEEALRRDNERLAALMETAEGKHLIAMAQELRSRSIKAGVPLSGLVAGVAPFGLDMVEAIRAEAIAIGRAQERQDIMLMMGRKQLDALIGGQKNEADQAAQS